LIDQMAGIMGGRVAEEVVFGDVTSGAENDIQRVTQMARRMVTSWGMSEKVGTIQMGEEDQNPFLGRTLGTQRNYSEEVAAVIDEEVKSLVDDAHQTAKRILTERREKLSLVAERLKEVETLDGAELDRLLSAGEPPGASAAS
ncbi:MAG: hypothetical protein ACREPA_07570, partial [Candidatus Dormibacteraceae bacterium]